MQRHPGAFLCPPKWFLNIRNCILSMRVTKAGTGHSPCSSFLLSQKLGKISTQVQWTLSLWCFALKKKNLTYIKLILAFLEFFSCFKMGYSAVGIPRNS